MKNHLIGDIIYPTRWFFAMQYNALPRIACNTKCKVAIKANYQMRKIY